MVESSDSEVIGAGLPNNAKMCMAGGAWGILQSFNSFIRFSKCVSYACLSWHASDCVCCKASALGAALSDVCLRRQEDTKTPKAAVDVWMKLVVLVLTVTMQMCFPWSSAQRTKFAKSESVMKNLIVPTVVCGPTFHLLPPCLRVLLLPFAPSPSCPQHPRKPHGYTTAS